MPASESATRAVTAARVELRRAETQLAALKHDYGLILDQLGPAEFAFHQALRAYAAAQHELEREEQS